MKRSFIVVALLLASGIWTSADAGTGRPAPGAAIDHAAALAKSDNKSDACKIFENYAKTFPKASRGEKKRAKTLAKRIDC